MHAEDERVVAALAHTTFVLPTPDGRTFPFLSNDRGEKMLPAFTSDATFMIWEREQSRRFGRGTLPAADVFDTALAQGFDVVVIDPSGPNYVEFGRPDLTRIATALA
jgi:hypothetical protein